jgi:predicted lipid carrier protein YhbT
MDAKTLFEDRVPQMFKANPAKARETNAIFFFNITGEGGGKWVVDCKSDPPCVKAGESAAADCSIEVSAEDFAAGLKDPQQMMQLFFMGRLKVTGDPMLATKLQNIFQGA